MNLVELKDVWKIYRLGETEVYALKGLNLSIKKGEFVSIIGKSGSGKSTAMNMIGCLDNPTKGIVLLEGRDVSKLDEEALAKIRGKKIGFIFQIFNLIPSLNALENVMLPMVFQNVEEKKRTKKSKECLEIVEMEHRAYHTPNQLSGGERQRIAIARSLVNDPELILADEPTGNLDSASGEKIINLLKKLNKEEKRTVVLVTHDLALAKNSQRIITLKDGQAVK